LQTYPKFASERRSFFSNFSNFSKIISREIRENIILNFSRNFREGRGLDSIWECIDDKKWDIFYVKKGKMYTVYNLAVISIRVLNTGKSVLETLGSGGGTHHAEGRVDPKVDEGKIGFWFWIPQSM
jgi:hypothetical protein